MYLNMCLRINVETLEQADQLDSMVRTMCEVDPLARINSYVNIEIGGNKNDLGRDRNDS